MSVPDAITLSRLLLIAPFGWLLFAGFPRWSALGVFALAALTDGLDGYFARRLGQVSAAGARLDQTVDRVFTGLVVLLLLAHAWLRGGLAAQPDLPLLLGLACARELVALPGVAILWLRGGRLHHVERVGKIATALQSVTLGAIILGVSWARDLALGCALVGALSGAAYLRYALAPVAPRRRP